MSLYVEHEAWIMHRARLEAAEKKSRRSPGQPGGDSSGRGRRRARRRQETGKERQWHFAS